MPLPPSLPNDNVAVPARAQVAQVADGVCAPAVKTLPFPNRRPALRRGRHLLAGKAQQSREIVIVIGGNVNFDGHIAGPLYADAAECLCDPAS